MGPTIITITVLSASTAVLAFLYIRAVMRERTMSINNRINEMQNRINEMQNQMWREDDSMQEKIKDIEGRLSARNA